MIRLEDMTEEERKRVSALSNNASFLTFFEWLEAGAKELVIGAATAPAPDMQSVAEVRGAAGVMYQVVAEIKKAFANESPAVLDKLESEGYIAVAFDDSDRNTPPGSGALMEGTPAGAPGRGEQWTK